MTSSVNHVLGINVRRFFLLTLFQPILPTISSFLSSSIMSCMLIRILYFMNNNTAAFLGRGVIIFYLYYIIVFLVRHVQTFYFYNNIVILGSNAIVFCLKKDVSLRVRDFIFFLSHSYGATFLIAKGL